MEQVERFHKDTIRELGVNYGVAKKWFLSKVDQNSILYVS